MSIAGFKELSGVLTTWIGIISAVVGGALWLQAYLGQASGKVTDQQKESVAFLDKYSAPDILQLRAKFHALGKAVASQIDGPPTSGGNAAVEAYLLSAQQAAAKQIRDQDMSLDIQRLIQFYDSLEICGVMGVCDAKMSRRLFKDEAYYIYNLLKVYVDTQNRTRPSFGAGLKAIAYDSASAAP